MPLFTAYRILMAKKPTTNKDAGFALIDGSIKNSGRIFFIELFFKWAPFWLALFYHAFLICWLHVRGVQKLEAGDITPVILSAGALACLFALTSLAFPRLRSVRVVCNSFIIAYLCLAGAFVYKNKFTLDYAAVAENVGLARSRGSVEFILESLNCDFQVLTVIILGLYYFVEIRGKVRPPVLPWKKRVCAMAALMLGYGIYLFSPIPKIDEVGGFFTSAAWYHWHNRQVTAGSDQNLKYPYIHDGADFVSMPELEAGTPPSVFLLIMESFCQSYVEAQDPSGRDYTPFFNQLIPQGVYVENFYANSMQTAKGQFAVLFSLAPAIRGKVFVHYPDMQFESLASVLKKQGYQTLFFQAYENPDFDNTRNMLLKNGFDDFQTLKDHLKPEDEALDWGWGPEDAVLYRRFFEYLNAGKENHTGPLFAVQSTINSHRCGDVPEDKRPLYAHPANIWEIQANAVHLADLGLEVFFQELAKQPEYKNAVIVITGDHGVNLRSDSVVGATLDASEDIFRVPLLILQPGGISPLRIKNEPFSQMDIAPTLLDILHIREALVPFQGRSLFQADGSNRALLVQPYRGRYLGSVRAGYKYVVKERTNQSWAFALDGSNRFPREIAVESLPLGLIESFEQDVAYLRMNQSLIVENRIWPVQDQGAVCGD